MLITVFPYVCLPIVIIIYIIITMLFKIFDLKKRNQILQEEYEKAILREKQLLLLTIKLKRGFISNYSVKSNKAINPDKDLEDAVKLAMKVSHPDNGGNPANFIRFQELYIRIKNKRRE